MGRNRSEGMDEITGRLRDLLYPGFIGFPGGFEYLPRSDLLAVERGFFWCEKWQPKSM